MRLFLILISTLVITTILIFLGTDTSDLSGNLSQAIRVEKDITWQRVQGGKLREHDDREFNANTIYTSKLADDLLITTWSTTEPLTSPLTQDEDYSFTMQAYSGYLFQSFDPLASYALE